jgi:hypothetical protein
MCSRFEYNWRAGQRRVCYCGEAKGRLPPNGGEDALWREPTHANANTDADARDSYLVSCFKLVSAQAFVVYRMDPYVVVFCPSALGCRVVGFSSQGTGPDLYSCTSGVRLVVLDTPSDCNAGMEWIWCFSQQQKSAEKAYLAHSGLSENI